MNDEPQTACAACSGPLPDGSRSDRRYCSAACRRRASRRRSAELNDRDESRSARWHLDNMHRELSKERAQREREKITSQKRAEKITQLERELASRDRYIQEQAERNATATRRAASLKIQLDQLRADHDARVAIDPAEVQRLRANLEEGRSAYRQLRQSYDKVNNAIEGAVKERESLKHIVRQWDRLCKRLYEQTNGKPRTEKDQEILEMWRLFRKKNGKPVQ